MAPPRVFVLQHHPLEHEGWFGQALLQAGATVCPVRLYAGEALPGLTPRDGLLIMGGPMSVREQSRYPWMQQEVKLVQEAITQEQPVMGVCLGSQIIATAAGSAVTPGTLPEVGWYTVEFCPEAMRDPIFRDAPHRLAAFEWHSEGFALPPSAVLLARNQNYPVQAFRVGRKTYGLLFHIEVNQAMVAAWKGTFGLPKGPLAEPQASQDYSSANRLADTIVRRLFLAGE